MISRRPFNFRSHRPAALNFLRPRAGGKFRWLLAGRFFLILLFVVPAYSSDVAALQLQPAAQVDGEGIFIQQIITSPEALPILKLCPAPAFGQTTELSRTQINDLLIKLAPDLATTNWSGPDTIRISRRSHEVDEPAMLAQLTTAFQDQIVKDKGDLELSFTEPWTTVVLPDEMLKLRILEMPTSGISPYFITRFEVCTAHETIGVFQASLRAHVWRDVWVLHSAAARGSQVIDADLGRERRDVLNIRESLANFEEGDNSQEFAENVPAGFPLLARALKPKSVIHRGDTAEGRLDDGALSIKLKVVALEDGAPGQLIKLRNPASSHYLNGKVLDEQTVLISL